MRKLYGLQYLRAVAACAVVGFHAAARVGREFTIGEAGVDLFFLISGFLMVVITDRDTGPGAFLLDRIKRIVPNYWIATAVVLAASSAGLFPNMRLDAWHTVSSFLFVPTASPGMPDRTWPLLIPGWTLNYEMAFYGVFATVLLLPRTARLPALTLLLVLPVALGPVLAALGAAGAFYAQPIVLEFLAGAWLGFLWARPGYWPRKLGVPLIAAALFGLAAAAAFPESLPRPVAFGGPALLMLGGILCIERAGDGVPYWFLPRLIGDASYSIYLWHTLAISASGRIAARLGLDPAVAIALGIAAFMLVEKPNLRFF